MYIIILPCNQLFSKYFRVGYSQGMENLTPITVDTAKIRRNYAGKQFVNAFGSASKVVEGLEKHGRIFCFTKGQFSLSDLVAAILRRIGPANLNICTWTMGRPDIDTLSGWNTAGMLLNVRMVLDIGFIQFKQLECAMLKQNFGEDCIRLTRNHAKIMTIRNGEWDIVIHGSCNFTINPRVESIEIEDNAEICDFVKSYMEEVWRTAPVGLSVESSEVRQGYKEIFGGAKQKTGDIDDW